MLEVISALILYVCSLPCLYGIMRLAVRHGIRDADQIRYEASWEARERAARQSREQTILQSRTHVPQDAYPAGG